MIKNQTLITCLDVSQRVIVGRLQLVVLTLLTALLMPSAMFAQLRFNTITKDIVGHEGSEGHYYLIASPLEGDVDPDEVGGMTYSEFDLYYFDQGEELEWRNYKAEAFSLKPGKGYLYASYDNVDLTFTGNPYHGSGEVTLFKIDESPFPGWNLVGNPYAQEVYLERSFYRMNSDGSELIAGEGNIINPMEGIFVLAEVDGEVIRFMDEGAYANGSMFALNLSNSHGTIDRAIVRFSPGCALPKLQLRKNSTKLFIPMGDTDYAVVCGQSMGEMPVHFKAENNGNYTISLSSENVRFKYLHLIDNLTANEIDLLAHPNYTFEAKTTDDTSRFRMVYAVIPPTSDNLSGENENSSEVSSSHIKRDATPQLPNHGEEDNQDASAGASSFTIHVEAGFGGSVDGGGSYEEGSEISLQATADDGYCFINWTEDGDVVSTENPYEFDVYEERTLKANFALLLKDAEDNSQALYGAEAENVRLQGRTLYKDGSWNTLCLPFTLDATQVSTMLEDPEKLMTLNEASFVDGTLTLDFVGVTTITAGKPYIIRWAKANDYVDDEAHNLYEPTFTDVTVSSATENVETSWVDFIGTTSPVTLTEGDHTKLYLGTNNDLYYPATDVAINSCRAYFILKSGLMAGAPTDNVQAFVLNFGDETNTIDLLRFTMDDKTDIWYTPDGKKLKGLPTAKGLYIRKGHKVVIR